MRPWLLYIIALIDFWQKVCKLKVNECRYWFLHFISLWHAQQRLILSQKLTKLLSLNRANLSTRVMDSVRICKHLRRGVLALRHLSKRNLMFFLSKRSKVGSPGNFGTRGRIIWYMVPTGPCIYIIIKESLKTSKIELLAFLKERISLS